MAIATHQLEGPARAWWDNFCDNHPDPAHITWDEFCLEFRKQHIPEGLWDMKADEFRNLKQGTMKVEEYEQTFHKMLRYAPEEGHSDARKQYWFKRGLHHGIH